MLNKQDIICISSIDWDFIWQGHQEIMSALAAKGNRILFIENTGVRPPNLKDLPRLKKRIYNWFHSVKGIRQERENLYILSPLILPFPYSRIARFINTRLVLSVLKRWIASIGFSRPIIWTFLPTGLVINIINSINSKLVVYYCIDNFEASSQQAKRIIKSEQNLLKRADMVFVTSKSLYDKCSAINKNVHIFPYGVNIDVYEKSKARNEIPQELAGLKHPIIGYVGGVHKWVDLDLVKYLAASNRDKTFIFVGPLQVDVGALKNEPNVIFTGQKKYEDLGLYISKFDACLIPYKLAEYTKNVYPTKINEYFYLGKPVVSTALQEVEAFNRRNGGTVMIAGSKEEFSGLVNKAVDEKPGSGHDLERIRIAMQEGSWEKKIENMSDIIEKKILDLEAERSVKWKDNLLKFYEGSRKRLIPLLACLAIGYLAIFYTPLMWVLAEPLKISDAAKPADAIVVLGGGVGESGKAGQGYQERVLFGVELYDKKYAGHIIFSSGYKYIFEETAVMKAMAVSLGVPGNAIIQEDEARNTMEQVVKVRDILKKRGWKTALLASSPYHMRRLSLVAHAAAPDISFTYTPLPKSAFYARYRENIFSPFINLQQIKGILHEYLAIAYYWGKGWI